MPATKAMIIILDVCKEQAVPQILQIVREMGTSYSSDDSNWLLNRAPIV